MATRTLQQFVLNVLEIASRANNGDLESLWRSYNERYPRLTFEAFAARLKEASSEELVSFAGARIPGVDDLAKTVMFSNRNERGREFKTYWGSLSLRNITVTIEQLKDELGLNTFKNVNQEVFDALVRHQIYLLRLSGGVRNDIVKLLNATEDELVRKIQAAVDAGAGYGSPAALKRLQALERYIKTIRLKSWEQIDETWLSQIIDIAKTETAFMEGIFHASSPVVIDFAIPTAQTIRSIVATNPFEGKVLKEWADGIAKSDIDRILAQIRIGMVQGETGKEIAKRIVGSATLQGSDGVTEITRRNAAALTRTAILAITGAVRDEFINENAEYFDGERFVATLDSRTTPVCRANDGKIFPVGEGPRPPLHFNCRSIRVPIFDGVILGERPAKPTTTKQLLREFTAENGLDSVSDRADLPRGYKTAFDKWASARIRAATERVMADVSYNEWLKAQPMWFQNDVLGTTRAALFRTGKLDLDKYVDKQGNELTLKELAKKYAGIFRDAGLDPSDYF